MSNNTFWITFWGIIALWYCIGYYFDYQTEKYKADSNVQIAKMREDSNKKLQEIMKESLKAVQELKEGN